MRSMCVFIAVALISFHGLTKAESDLFAGIEIGGSGAKGFVYELKDKKLSPVSGSAQRSLFKGQELGLSKSGVALHLSRDIENRQIGIASALNEQTLSSDTLVTISQNVATLLVQAMVNLDIKLSNIFIFGSSSVEKARNVDKLVARIISESEKLAVDTPPASE